VESLHPAAEVAANPAGEVQLLHPGAGTGCSQRSGGVQLTQSRGAAAAPEPSREPSTEPPAARARALGAPAGRAADGGGPVSEFFAVLGDGWKLTATQRARLSPAVSAALGTGWTPGALAAFTGANTAGVHNLWVPEIVSPGV